MSNSMITALCALIASLGSGTIVVIGNRRKSFAEAELAKAQAAVASATVDHVDAESLSFVTAAAKSMIADLRISYASAQEEIQEGKLEARELRQELSDTRRELQQTRKDLQQTREAFEELRELAREHDLPVPDAWRT